MYNDEPYYFMKNLQGDVIAITDRNGLVVARYSYDAWGVCTIEQDSAYCIGGINPYRYRGYYYDSEIGMYYLQSRYYDPAAGRFVNADTPEMMLTADSILETNFFDCCYNSPINNIDPSGYFTITRWMISIPLDIALMAIPIVGSFFAPVKALAKKLGVSALKKALKTPLVKFITTVAKYVSKIVTAIKNVVMKVPFIGRWLAGKIPTATKIGYMLSGGVTSATVNKLLNVIVPNITSLLSAGGLVAGFLDWYIDNNFNNKVWSF